MTFHGVVAEHRVKRSTFALLNLSATVRYFSIKFSAVLHLFNDALSLVQSAFCAVRIHLTNDPSYVGSVIQKFSGVFDEKAFYSIVLDTVGAGLVAEILQKAIDFISWSNKAEYGRSHNVGGKFWIERLGMPEIFLDGH